MVFTSKLGTHESKLVGLKFGRFEPLPFGVANPTSPILFSQSATEHATFNRVVLSTISFTQSANSAKTYSRTVNHTLSFIHINSVFTIHTVKNILTFTEVASALSYKGLNHTLSFVQTLASQYNPHFDTKQHTVSFVQTPVCTVVRPRVASNVLVFSQSAVGLKVRFFSTSNTILFSPSVTESKIVFPHNTLSFTQSVSVHKVANRTIITPLSFVTNVTKGLVLTRSVHSTLHFVGGQNRQINLAYPEFYTIPVAIVTKANDVVVLQSASQVIVLPAPEMADGQSPMDNMNLRRTMNGAIYTYVKRTGLSKLEYKFIMDRGKAYELRNFVQNNLSLQQTLTNWKGEIWVGYMSNNPFNFTNIPGYGPCGELYEATIEFEATRIH